MERRQIRLIASDLDGTLLRQDKSLSERNLSAIRAAVRSGIHFVPATGRMYSALPDFLKELPFLRYFILSNGAGVYDRQEDRMLFQAEISQEEGMELFAYIRSWDTMYDCYMDGKAYMAQSYYDQVDTYIIPELREMVKGNRTPVPVLEDFVAGKGSFQKIQMFFTDMAKREKVLEELPLRFPSMAVTSSISNNIEINIASANKGTALKVLSEKLGIDLTDTVAFGDGTNDLTMLGTAGIGVAMGNAMPEVKEAADIITGTNQEDGFADFLEKYVL